MLPDPTHSSNPLPLTTNLTDRLNVAVQFEKIRDVLRKRWWIIAICVAGAIAISGYRAYQMPDIYQARGTMMLTPRIKVLGETYSEEQVSFYGTQISLVQSPQVVNAAEAKLGELARSLPIPPRAQLTVIRERETSIFRLTAKSTSPEYARLFIDQVMEEYISLRKRIRDQTSEVTAATLVREVERLDKVRHEIEAKVFAFQKENNLAVIEGQGNIAVQYLITIKQRLAEVRTEMDLLSNETAEQRMKRLPSPNSPESFTPENQNAISNSIGPVTAPSSAKVTRQSDYSNLKNAISLLRAERDAKAKTLRAQHSIMVHLDEEIERKERLLKLLFEQTQEEVEAYRQSLIHQEETLQKNMTEWEKQALEANKKAAEYSLLKGEADRNKELYGVLLKRLQEVEFNATAGQESVAISEKASVNATPIGPNRLYELISGAGIGLAVAVILIFLLERSDDRINSAKELQDLVSDPVLGQIPLVDREGGKKGDEAGPLMMWNLPPQNPFSESMRNVRSSLMFSPSTREARIIAVTSAIPDDGKTTVAVNLSVCFSQAEHSRTLLIDMDLRRMTVHRYFNISNDYGVSEVLKGEMAFADAIVHTNIPNLDILCAGKAPSNPGELILSDNFNLMLQTAAASYDRVILDTCPVLITDDTLSLASKVNGIVLVVRAGRTSMGLVSDSMQVIKQRGAKLLGILLNGIDTRRAQYYYYYYYSSYYHHPQHSEKADNPDAAKQTLG